MHITVEQRERIKAEIAKLRAENEKLEHTLRKIYCAGTLPTINTELWPEPVNTQVRQAPSKGRQTSQSVPHSGGKTALKRILFA